MIIFYLKQIHKIYMKKLIEIENLNENSNFDIAENNKKISLNILNKSN